MFWYIYFSLVIMFTSMFFNEESLLDFVNDLLISLKLNKTVRLQSLAMVIVIILLLLSPIIFVVSVSYQLITNKQIG